MVVSVNRAYDGETLNMTLNYATSRYMTPKCDFGDNITLTSPFAADVAATAHVKDTCL